MQKISSIHLQGREYHLVLDEHNARVIEANGKFYTSAAAWMQGEQISKNEGSWLAAARSVCFFQGERYQVIEDTKGFSQKYKKKLERDKAFSQDSEIPKTGSWGTYNVEGMEPKWEGGVLEFFVEDTLTGVPYRVRWEKPDGSQPAKCTFSLLAMQPPKR